MKLVWLAWCFAAGLALLPASGLAQSATPAQAAQRPVTRDVGRVRYGRPGQPSVYSAHARFSDQHPLPSGPTGTGRVVFNQTATGAAAASKAWQSSDTGRVSYTGTVEPAAAVKHPYQPSDTGRVQYGPSPAQAQHATPAPQPAAYRMAPVGAAGTGRVHFAVAGAPLAAAPPPPAGNNTGRVQYGAAIPPGVRHRPRERPPLRLARQLLWQARRPRQGRLPA